MTPCLCILDVSIPCITISLTSKDKTLIWNARSEAAVASSGKFRSVKDIMYLTKQLPRYVIEKGIIAALNDRKERSTKKLTGKKIRNGFLVTHYSPLDPSHSFQNSYLSSFTSYFFLKGRSNSGGFLVMFWEQ